MVTQNPNKTPDDPNVDPDPDDVVEPTAEDGRPAAEAAEGKADDPAPDKSDDEPSAPRAPSSDDARAQIFAKHSKRSLERGEKWLDNNNDQTMQFGTDPIAGTKTKGEEGDADDPEPGQQDEPQDPKGDDDDPLMTIKVDGQERQVRQSEVVAAYQKHQTADQRLHEASELVRQVKDLEARLKQPAPDNDPEKPDAASSPTKPDDESVDRELAEIAEAIQVGDTEQATQALKRLRDTLRDSEATSSDDVQQLVQSTFRAEEERKESEQALHGFVEKHPEIAEDPMLPHVLAKFTQQAMYEDLRSAGISDDELRSRIQGPEHLVQVHRQMRLARIEGIRSTADLLNSASERYTTWSEERFGKPKSQAPADNDEPSPSLADRRERKRSAQSQPAARTSPSPGSAQPPKPQSRKDAVREMRQSRGQPVA